MGSGRDAVRQSLINHGMLDPEEQTDPVEKEHAEHALNTLTDRVMAAKHYYGNSDSLLKAATEAQAPTGTAFKNTEYGNDTKGKASQTAYLADKRHIEGKDFHMEDMVDKETGQTILEDDLDTAGQKQYERVLNEETGEIESKVKQRASRKLIVHDATGKYYHSLNVANGHDRDAAINMFARTRGAMNQSGRVDVGGAGFGDGVAQIQQMYDTSTKIDENANLSYDAKQLAMRDEMSRATDKALESVATGNDLGLLSGGKPYGAEAIGRKQYMMIKEHSEALETARARGDELGIRRSERSLKQAVAGAAGIWDSMGQRSQLNSGALSRVMMGQTVPGVGPKGEDMTVLDYYSTITQDPDVMEYRREFGINNPNLTPEQRAALAAGGNAAVNPTDIGKVA
jgi:hypothetical protein